MVGPPAGGAPYHAAIVASESLEKWTTVACRSGGGAPTGTLTGALSEAPTSHKPKTPTTTQKVAV